MSERLLGPVGVAVLGGIFLIAMVIFAVWADGKDEQACRNSGGHRVTHHSYGYTSDGKSITITETECVHDSPR